MYLFDVLLNDEYMKNCIHNYTICTKLEIIIERFDY